MLFSFKKIALFFLPVMMLLIVISGVSYANSSIYGLNQSGQLTNSDLPSKTVILTFDDGPSSYTPKILSILRSKGLKATFFVVGKEAEKHKILRSIYDSGNDIGNHTYSHSDLSKLPAWHARLELSLNRLIIESQIGHSTRIMRPPYLGSDSLSSQSIDVVKQVGRQGYITIGENIDSEDWRRPGVGKIIANATTGLAGGIILMHDGGGDRSQTVKALPYIINYYQKKGYQFMTVSQALNLSRPQVMPVPTPVDLILSHLIVYLFSLGALIIDILYGIILTLIIASFGRMILVIIAALVQSRRLYPAMRGKDIPCTVVVPAYNEASVIESCLRSILDNNYQSFEVIVIDDGSLDKTFEIARSIVDSRLRVIQKINGGKASALNYGIAQAGTDFIIAIDADTVFKPNTLRQLMRHFQNQRVGAVSGNTRIANRHKLITKLQSLEYVVGFNLDRRMGDLFDCITVVPGAIGAFRKSVLLDVGGFSYDTLAEDTDLTLSIQEAGYSIIYDADAVAYTEAPATISDLLKQRFRWTFGTMQAVWKHKHAVLNHKYGTLGLIGLPFLLFYQILFPLLGPLFDASLIIGLLNHQYHLMAISFILYTVADIIMSGTALKLDGENFRQLWLLIPQRILYRQLMYYVIIRSVVNVLKGRLVKWGSLKREGKHLAQAND